MLYIAIAAKETSWGKFWSTDQLTKWNQWQPTFGSKVYTEDKKNTPCIFQIISISVENVRKIWNQLDDQLLDHWKWEITAGKATENVACIYMHLCDIFLEENFNWAYSRCPRFLLITTYMTRLHQEIHVPFLMNDHDPHTIRCMVIYLDLSLQAIYLFISYILYIISD